MKVFFGVDIGGTSVKWAVITGDYEILKRGEFQTPYGSPEDLVEQIAKSYEAAGEGGTAGCLGIGVSVPGTLKVEPDGVVEGGGTLRYLDMIPLGKMLRERLGIPCFVENDGKSCALGEYTTGALKGCKVGVALVLGTGVGGGIVINGEVYKGVHAFAGEFSFIMEQPGHILGYGPMFGATCGWRAGLVTDYLGRAGLAADTKWKLLYSVSKT